VARHWYPPAGPPGCHSREWVAYRGDVREAAGRWCDRPASVGGADAELLSEWACIGLGCDLCAACEARELVMRGEA